VRAAIALLTLVAATSAGAQPVAPPEQDTGFIGRGAARLEIDDCPPSDPTATEAQLTARVGELYQRGVVLYTQGDYTGAVREFISYYCVAGGFERGRQVRYSVLKDIGQSHERSLDYEKAIGYFERYVRELPADAAADKQLSESRILVLQKLRAQIFVETSPGGATVTISNESGVAGRGRSGQPIEVPGGTYTMLVELAGHEPYSRQLEVRIGKPFAVVVPLRPLRGRLSVQVTPGDAKVFLRDRSVERFVGVGRADEMLATGEYVLIADAPDRLTVERPIEVLPNRVNRMQIDLPLKPQFGRRQLIAFSAIGAAYSSLGLLYAFDDGAVPVLGMFGGAAAGLLGSLLYLPEQVPRGTSNLTITSGLTGTAAGIVASLVFTDEAGVVLPIMGATTLLGAGVGYYVGSRTNVTPGDAALFASSAFWGTAAGGMFALSFGGSDRRISAGLFASGLGMGAVSGILMGRYFDVSRRRTVLIDVGGLIGLIGGLAAESLAYPDDEAMTEGANEHAANFMLGGVAIGLIGAGILTRNLDAPKIPVKPAIGTAATAGGASTVTYGLSGTW
jgi:hypothetical protein